MAKKGSLFALIKTLSKAEKRHFRLYAAIGRDEANYLKLFDAIDAQEEFDEAAIRKKFKGEKFTAQLHVTKIYLQELIIRSLRNYHSKNSVSTRLLDLLRDIEILFNRELYDLCFYKIEKAEKLAATHEKYPLLSEILGWKRKLLMAKSGGGISDISPVTSQDKAAIEKMLQLNDYWNVTANIFSYFHNDQLEQHPLVRSSEKATSLQAKSLRRHLRYSAHFMKGNIAAADKEVSALIKLHEKYPDRIEDDPAAYITAISNKIALYFRNKKWDAIPPLILKMRQTPERFHLKDDSKFTVRMWLRLFNLEMEMYRDTKQVSKGIALIDEISRYLKAHGKAITPGYRLLFYYQFASIHFLGRNYSGALPWLNEIINGNFGDLREEIQGYARLLNLVVHFELENIMVLRYAVDSSRRFLKKKKLLHTFEAEVLSLFSSLSVAYPENYADIFRKGYNRLFLSPEKTSDNALDYLNLREWMNEKISREKISSKARSK